MNCRLNLTCPADFSLKANEGALLLSLALELADSSRKLITRKVEEKLSVEKKADRSFVTNLDKLVEENFRTVAARLHPEAGVIGEEYGYSKPEAEYQWVVDPIDGTAELVAGVPTFGTVTSLLFRGYPVAGVIDMPLMNVRVEGVRGGGCSRNGVPVTLDDQLPEKVRIHMPPAEAFLRRGAPSLPSWYTQVLTRYPANRTYFTCLSLAAAAYGGVDASVEHDLRIWDFAPAPLFVEEAGGSFDVFARYEDNEQEERFSFVMGKKTLVRDIRSLIESAA